MGEEAKKGKPNSQLSQQGPENTNVEAEHFFFAKFVNVRFQQNVGKCIHCM